MRTSKQVTKEINDLQRERYTTIWNMSRETMELTMKRYEALLENSKKIEALEEERKELEKAEALEQQRREIERLKSSIECEEIKDSVEHEIAELKNRAIKTIALAYEDTSLDADAINKKVDTVRKGLKRMLHNITTDKDQIELVMVTIESYISSLIEDESNDVEVEVSIERSELALNLRGSELDDLIFEYQSKTDLTYSESRVLIAADTAYLQDNEELAAKLMSRLVAQYEEGINTICGGSIK